MSIQQNFPAISPSLSLNFARSKTLDPRITFSRTSSATRTNELGLIEVVPADAPRFDHRYENGVVKSLGLLVEESRTNFARFSGRPDVNWILDVSGGNGLSFIDGEIVTSSSGGLSATYVEELSSSTQIVTKLSSGFPAGVLTGATSGATRNITSQLSPGGATNVSAIITNEVVSPDGTQNALLVSPTTTGSQLRLVQKTYVTSTAGTYTFSIFFKNKNISNNTVAIRLSNQTATADVRANFNLVSKTFSFGTLGGWTGSVGYQEYPNGWIRIWVTATTLVDTHTSISGNFWLGGYQGTAETIGSMYVWESQIEAGAFPTSQIQTTYSTATRTPDNVSMTGENFSSWYNQSEGTIFCEYNRPSAVTSLRTIIAVSDNGFANRTNFRTDSATNLTIFTAVGGVGQTVFNLIMNSGANNKSICAYKLNDYNAASNGTIGTNDTSATVPVVDRMSIGSVLGAEPSCSYIRTITYYPRRLTNSQLQNLTK